MVSMCYLLNQLMDFDQTRIDTLLGEGEELIKFGYPIKKEKSISEWVKYPISRKLI